MKVALESGAIIAADRNSSMKDTRLQFFILYENFGFKWQVCF